MLTKETDLDRKQLKFIRDFKIVTNSNYKQQQKNTAKKIIFSKQKY